MKGLLRSGQLIVLIALLTSCMADIRTASIKKEGITPENQKKGRELLLKTRKKHGLDQLKQHKTYQYTAHDSWKGFLGKVGKVWPEPELDLDFKYIPGTFEGKVQYLSGDVKGLSGGLQSWHYYEIDNSGKLEFKRTNKRIEFGIAAFQYFFEVLDRMPDVPILAYAGEQTVGNQSYEILFATWHKAEPHKEHDQYLLYINKETGYLDFLTYTIRDNYLPVSWFLHGTVKYENLKIIDGITVPFTQKVYLLGPHDEDKNLIHELSISDFKFDIFEPEELYPDKSLPRVGNSKEGKQ
ncbi:hypothetical protein [Jiulongibacter sediminis]|jgi:hypothetical protein|uniref:hypothetical protein n=1 Tax=Jiulongibacter sediminis TaxID=1605367 RepID=UPI0026F2F92F|nr:hypothetical protein [Jiulongibacter sediminis]